MKGYTFDSHAPSNLGSVYETTDRRLIRLHLCSFTFAWRSPLYCFAVPDAPARSMAGSLPSPRGAPRPAVMGPLREPSRFAGCWAVLLCCAGCTPPAAAPEVRLPVTGSHGGPAPAGPGALLPAGGAPCPAAPPLALLPPAAPCAPPAALALGLLRFTGLPSGCCCCCCSPSIPSESLKPITSGAAPPMIRAYSRSRRRRGSSPTLRGRGKSQQSRSRDAEPHRTAADTPPRSTAEQCWPQRRAGSGRCRGQHPPALEAVQGGAAVLAELALQRPHRAGRDVGAEAEREAALGDGDLTLVVRVAVLGAVLLCDAVGPWRKRHPAEVRGRCRREGELGQPAVSSVGLAPGRAAQPLTSAAAWLSWPPGRVPAAPGSQRPRRRRPRLPSRYRGRPAALVSAGGGRLGWCSPRQSCATCLTTSGTHTE